MSSFFNFREECKKITFSFKNLNMAGLYKYDQDIYDLFMDSFDMIPLACVINGKFLAVHGGISPEMKTVYFLKFLVALTLYI